MGVILKITERKPQRYFILAVALLSAVFLLHMTKEYGCLLNNGYVRADTPKLLMEDLRYDTLGILTLTFISLLCSAFISGAHQAVMRISRTVDRPWKLLAGIVFFALFNRFVVRTTFTVNSVSWGEEYGETLFISLPMARGFLSFPGAAVFAAISSVYAAAFFVLIFQPGGQLDPVRTSKRDILFRVLCGVAALGFLVAQRLNYDLSSQRTLVEILAELLSWIAYPVFYFLRKSCKRKWIVYLFPLVLAVLFIVGSFLFGHGGEAYDIQPIRFFARRFGIVSVILYVFATAILMMTAFLGWYQQENDEKHFRAFFFALLLSRWIYAVSSLFIPSLNAGQRYAMPFTGPYAFADIVCYGACLRGWFLPKVAFRQDAKAPN